MEGQAAATDARCPRCGGAFHCGVHDAAPCACGTLKLTAELRTMLGSRYTGCLCLSCLRQLAAESAAAAPAR